jgi:hypothetical protein
MEAHPWDTVLSPNIDQIQLWHPGQVPVVDHLEPEEIRLKPSGERKRSFWAFVPEHGTCSIRELRIHHSQASFLPFNVYNFRSVVQSGD